MLGKKAVRCECVAKQVLLWGPRGLFLGELGRSLEKGSHLWFKNKQIKKQEKQQQQQQKSRKTVGLQNKKRPFIFTNTLRVPLTGQEPC